MCGRFNLTAPGEEIAAAFDLDEVPELSARYNIAPSQPVAAVGFQPKTGRRGLAELAWGLALRDARPGEKRLINARSETVADRPSLASVGETTPQVCVGGDPLAESTLDHAKARDDDGVHWRVGAVGAAWAWRAWIVPAIADTPGITG